MTDEFIPNQFTYTKLQDAKVGEVINVIAVVKFHQNPIRTKSSSFKMTISITDPSIGFDNKLICNIFNDKAENLPRVSNRGDVIVMHRLRINEFNNKPQGTGPQKSGFTTAVFPKEVNFDIKNNSYSEINSLMRCHQTNFQITMNDFKVVQDLKEWSNNMPSSQEQHEDIDLERYTFQTLSDIHLNSSFALAAQLVGIVVVPSQNDQPVSSDDGEPAKQNVLLFVWDGTLLKHDLNKNYLNLVNNAEKSIFNHKLMAMLGGKFTNPYLVCLKYCAVSAYKRITFLQTGDMVYFTKLSVEPADKGPGVILKVKILTDPDNNIDVLNSCHIGHLNSHVPQFQQLKTRLSQCPDQYPCIADCTSPCLDKLKQINLRDVGRFVNDLNTRINENGGNTEVGNCMNTQFKVIAKVAQIYPNTVKDFYKSIVMFCIDCETVHNDDFSDKASLARLTCGGNMVPIPMVTMILEDFSGWLGGVVVGKHVLNMMSMVMMDASHTDWWVRVVSGTSGNANDQSEVFNRSIRTESKVKLWLLHMSNLLKGWIEAKLVMRCQQEDKVIPFFEDMVILDQD